MDSIKDLLRTLKIDKLGSYDDHKYVILLQDSDEYAKMYTTLDKNAVNTEYPNINKNTNNSTIGITNYFETSFENKDYTIILTADFEKDLYTVKIGEKE